MIVVADTGPLNYLIQIECDDLLPKLYERIIVPSGVMQELAHPTAPALVREWLTHVPAWIDIRLNVSSPDIDLADLDLGEREAIQLAEEHQAELLLIDERKGRRRATQRGLRTIGTLGVLLSAGEMRLIDPSAAYHRLVVETNFRTSAELEVEFLARLKIDW